MVGWITWSQAFDAFVIALATGLAGAIVFAVVSLFRYARRMDRRAHALMRWAHTVGHLLGVPFSNDDEKEL